MDTLFVPNENDFRRWIREALIEALGNKDPAIIPSETAGPNEEPLLTRKEIAGVFRVTLVTLHDWMKKGLPFHKQEGRVYFIRSEVMEYLKQKRNGKYIFAAQSHTFNPNRPKNLKDIQESG